MPNGKNWRVTKPCADCPFSTSAAGTHLRKSLGRGRMAEIQKSLRSNEHFLCHKTTDETGNGSNLVCAGSIEWQEKQGVSANYVRICERLDWMHANREKTA